MRNMFSIALWAIICTYSGVTGYDAIINYKLFKESAQINNRVYVISITKKVKFPSRISLTKGVNEAINGEPENILSWVCLIQNEDKTIVEGATTLGFKVLHRPTNVFIKNKKKSLSRIGNLKKKLHI